MKHVWSELKDKIKCFVSRYIWRKNHRCEYCKISFERQDTSERFCSKRCLDFFTLAQPRIIMHFPMFDPQFFL